jgi:hypothetical protein
LIIFITLGEWVKVWGNGNGIWKFVEGNIDGIEGWGLLR